MTEEQRQTRVYRKVIAFISELYPKWNITRIDSDYFAIDNGKRFIAMHNYHGTSNRIFLGIREDGNTRTVFAGHINSIEDFTIINNLTQK